MPTNEDILNDYEACLDNYSTGQPVECHRCKEVRYLEYDEWCQLHSVSTLPMLLCLDNENSYIDVIHGGWKRWDGFLYFDDKEYQRLIDISGEEVAKRNKHKCYRHPIYCPRCSFEIFKAYNEVLKKEPDNSLTYFIDKYDKDQEALAKRLYEEEYAKAGKEALQKKEERRKKRETKKEKNDGKSV